MAENTSIEWCDATFNPWTGCTKVSPGCDSCYAEAWSKRAGAKVGKWGPGAPRVRTTPANWAKPLKWNATPFMYCPRCEWRGEESECVPHGDACPKCGKAATPARRRVFCASLADVFDNEVPAEWRAELFDLIAQTPNLDWLLLTKRIGNATKMMANALGVSILSARMDPWPLPNVWLGATIVNQEEADRDIPKLVATPARVRFLSMEPLLGPVNLQQAVAPVCPQCKGAKEVRNSEDGGYFMDCPCERMAGLRWVIAGGESGHGARLAHPTWYRSLRDQCASAGVAFMFKQHGEWAWVRDIPETHEAKRGLWVRQNGETHDGSTDAQFTPGGTDALMWNVGKKAAGRLLDGVEHNGFPEVQA